MIRLKKREAFNERGTTYKIFINDVYHGDIKGNESIELPTENGRHSIYAKIWWCQSNTFHIEVKDSIQYLVVETWLTNKRLLIIFICSVLIMLAFSYFSFINSPPYSPPLTTREWIIENAPEGLHIPSEQDLELGRARNEALGIGFETRTYARHISLSDVIRLLMMLFSVGFVGVVISGVLFITVFKNRYLQIRKL